MTPDLRREVLADHARRRAGFQGSPHDGAWQEARMRSDTCGDDVTMRISVDGGRIAQLEWHGIGCEVSQASASMLAELVPGRPVAEVPALVGRVQALVQAPEGTEDPGLGDAEALAGVGRYPLRARCALLAWRALEAAALGAPAA
ncbi:Fe-S cluster assembly sulfur transfer protein SufU [Naasia sp. SYSU D00948]|uniref:Fe-S cluster assembly sulfur transfer protein SufU n=1 Tax=Naasia sp. SYSU D00948 TaxID=2817379 RepID=UPI001B304835|nr:SUF system NifU family Fe-S cluster assembly protein [Naasia sp. SYSU D00948]